MKSKILILGILLIATSVHSLETARVGVVVEFPDGEIFEKCVTGDEKTNGYEILERTGLNMEWGYHEAWGHSLCKIEDTGCPSSNCYCTPNYWNFYIKEMNEKNWEYSPTGFDGGSTCNDHYCAEQGDLLGFAYGEYGTKPASPTFDEICPTRRRTEKQFTVLAYPLEAYQNETITVGVLDKESKDPISKAKIEVYEGRVGSKKVFSGETNKNGTVILSFEEIGKYEMRVTVEDYHPPQEYLDLSVVRKPIETTTTTSSTILTTSTTLSTTTITSSTSSTSSTIPTSSLATSTINPDTLQSQTTKELEITGHAINLPLEGISITVLFIFFLLFLYTVYKR